MDRRNFFSKIKNTVTGVYLSSFLKGGEVGKVNGENKELLLESKILPQLAKKYGKALGILTFTKVCHFVAAIDLIRRSISLSTEAKPTEVLMTMGKKQIRNGGTRGTAS